MILTPSAVWKDFSINSDLTFEVIEEDRKDDLLITKLYLNGKTVSDGTVKIFGVLTRNVNTISQPMILCVQDIKDGTNDALCYKLADEGYASFIVDLVGKYPGRDKYTIYPNSLSYANYNAVEYESISVDSDVFHTCWYEWGCVIKYAIAFAKGQRFVSSIGVLGINEASTPLWYAIATEQDISCSVFVANAGWKGYRGIYKFESKENSSDDAKFKFLAAVDPQAYAVHASCPVFILSPTNSERFDLDRTYDTVERINETHYSACDYSIGSRETVSYDCFLSALIFLNNYLFGNNMSLPSSINIKAEIIDKKIMIEALPDIKNISRLDFYVAEGDVGPQYRSWRKIETKKDLSAKYMAEYNPYRDSGMVSIFARAIYNDGFSCSSPVVYKKFDENDIESSQKYRILYSSRLQNCESSFYPKSENVLPPYGLEIVKNTVVEEQKGPMDMYGLTCSRGILSYKINSTKYRPEIGMLLMFDVYCKEACSFTVSLVTDFYGKKMEYTCSVNVIGGDVWQNVKIPQTKFKTFEGMMLKSYDKVEVIEFYSEKPTLVNNMLWV